jgi:ABC-type amino acid transport substrate-binding protein
MSKPVVVTRDMQSADGIANFICLDESAPPFSSSKNGGTDGFDLKLAQAIANKLGRELQMQWFRTEDQPEPGKDTKSIIAAPPSHNRCELAGTYPLLTIALGDWMADKGRLPSFKGGKLDDGRRSISLSRLAPTVPFIYTAPAVGFDPDVPLDKFVILPTWMACGLESSNRHGPT